MKRFTKILVLLLMLVTVFTLAALPAFAEGDPTVTTPGTTENAGDQLTGEGGEETTEEVKKIDISVNFARFTDSLQYMWKGMLCIFIVIGVIITVTWSLNKVVNRIVEINEAKKNEEE